MDLRKAVFLDLASVGASDLDLSRLENSVPDWQWRENTLAEAVDSAIADAEIVVVNKVVLNERHLSIAKKLKLICVAATGVNNVDLAAAGRHSITVCNVRAYATASVVQHVFALLLSLTTKLDQYQQSVYNGKWSQSEFFCLLDYPVRELSGRTIGIVGYGELGSAVARVAEAFGMRVLIAKRDENDNREGRLSLTELLPQVDVLSLHCPLTQHNHHFIAAQELALMKSDAILINTARGGLVNEADLLSALNNNRLGGAALDVLEQEPPQANSLLLQKKCANLIITPHTAWSSRESRQRLIDAVAENIMAFRAGRPVNTVTD